jgi:hypothetical protein
VRKFEKISKCVTAVPVLLLFCAVSVFGQAKKANKGSSQVENARVWHRYVNKDEIDGERVAYYLPSVEDEKVTLLVVCPNGSKAGFASLNFPFRLYGASVSTLKFKTATGEVKEIDVGLTDGSDAMVASSADSLKPLVGSTFRVEDASAALHTYHLPAVGTAPFDSGCKSENR